ncbi:hypothetical protein [Halalkalibacter akibai]|uniref:Lipoprotein n=1 Tax=Halalkalibacter akibai (strain ATCC 43226 / DSM 21942 / CIP 109018 / JCM 9157 / 1139) TaxID=1236973 RepID=W4QZ11_HALA3|nr:hypothetical protein [Halalkalibacter akibai]GAE36534.1 hypothetical protein JCM9157_3728 [Halalkalibacter akibai JCM 9157]
MLKQLLKAGLVVAVSIGLVACGTNDTSELEDVTSGDEEVVEVDPAVAGGSDASEIKEIPVHVEGETEMRKAQFNRSGLGYSIYVLEDFQLESEEPNRDIIYSKFDQHYFARVIVHGPDADAENIKKNLLEHAEGDIEELEVPLSNVEFALHEMVESNGEKTSIKHLAKKYNGQLIEFTLFLPEREPIEGMEPSFWAMLETVDY